jgi:hypothetical protein
MAITPYATLTHPPTRKFPRLKLISIRLFDELIEHPRMP